MTDFYVFGMRFPFTTPIFLNLEYASISSIIKGGIIGNGLGTLAMS
jgi:hypothetical protein